MTETAQARFRHGYTQRFELALAGALVLHVLAMVLVPPRDISLPDIRLRPEPDRLVEFEPPREVRVVEPDEVARPSLTGAGIEITNLPDPVAAPVPELAPPAPPGSARISEKLPPFQPHEAGPRLIKSVEPVYPSLAREAGAEGTVVLDLRVADTGRVVGARVIRSDTIESLEKAAREAALQWLFIPGRQRGRAVPCIIRVSIRFRLS